MSKDISRRKALGAIAATGAAAAFGGAGTYAALSDNETAEIILTGGTLLLKVDPATATFEPASDYETSQGEPVEHTATWTISNEGTINASELFLGKVSATTNNTGQATPSQILNAAQITTFKYEGQEATDPPANLAELVTQQAQGNTPLESAAEDEPELPAFENETRELEIGIKFDYSQVDGNGGFSVTAKPEFLAEQ